MSNDVLFLFETFIVKLSYSDCKCFLPFSVFFEVHIYVAQQALKTSIYLFIVCICLSLLKNDLEILFLYVCFLFVYLFVCLFVCLFKSAKNL